MEGVLLSDLSKNLVQGKGCELHGYYSNRQEHTGTYMDIMRWKVQQVFL